ncbi:MAG: cysteine desulfurase [Phycisphaerales bacterium]|nr:cysteine desulfurase [Phycisphaerales bacterium]
MNAYLDNNATTQPLPEVVAAVSECLENCWANPSSVHRPGQASRARIEKARRSVADLIGAGHREVVFCSGGTESCQMAIRGALDWIRSQSDNGEARNVLVTSPVEHSAVRDLAKGMGECGQAEVRWLPIGCGGIIDAEASRSLFDDRVAVLSVQWANNETGAIQPAIELAHMAKEAGAIVHVDGTQWVGRLETDVRELPFDLLTFSAHKFHGPKGIGALWIRKGVKLCKQTPGSQELGRRGGTENVPGIVGLGEAAKGAASWLADPGNRVRIAELRDMLEAGVLERVEGACVNGTTDPDKRLWNTTNLALPGVDAEIMLLTLAEMGVCVSAGSACSSGSLEPSPVLCAMGLDKAQAAGSLRLSLSRFSTEAEVRSAVDSIVEAWHAVTASV